MGPQRPGRRPRAPLPLPLPHFLAPLPWPPPRALAARPPGLRLARQSVRWFARPSTHGASPTWSA
eukprot:14185062-Alexandrium_andersonii.AAC.1